ncbi:cilia- and flagella-associated protein 57 [Orussus abietinus]|uniref:cilia- and flagella-associated protein 57 n=1 Tax=Orussus abietinus TaxID=222816 RepID=UPI0006253D7E|nr:cilia- and flagella-associated protein 57 [Orussus abietinus]
MAIPVLQSRVFFGLKTDISGNAHYITDTDILYPVGSTLAIHNFVQRRQRIIRLPEKHRVNIISVTPNKRYAALCEIGDKPTISIYDLQTLKRKKFLGIPYEAPGVTKFSCISFTFDNKYLAAVTGEPDQTMLFYNWEKGKMESSLKVGNPQNNMSLVRTIHCNPGDAGIIAMGGPYAFKFLTVSESVWRPYGFAKADNILVSSMTWLNTDRLLAGTRDGRILYLENGDLKNIYKMQDISLMNLKIREEYVIQTTASQSSMEAGDDAFWEHDVRGLVAFNRGFAFGFGAGTLVVFERDGPHKYTKRNVYVVPEQASKQENPNLYRINCINANLSSDRLLVTTGWAQLFYAKLWGPDLNMDPEPRSLKIMGQMLHQGSISGLTMCAWKPMFMTCGQEDRSVRLWDYESESLVMLKQYLEDICSIALHPTGLFCLVGFSDKLRFMSILIDNLLSMQEFPIRNCKTVKFSFGGHMFAAVNGNLIQVYTTIGFRNRFILKGHTGRIQGIVWTQTDTKLVTIGQEGAIYDWDMSTGSRVAEVILKGIVLTDIVLTADAQTYYCLATDHAIREIKDGVILREFSIPGMEFKSMIMGKDDLMMFITCPGGIILSFKCPLQDPLEYSDFHYHSADTTHILLSDNEQIMISTSRDGSMCFWKVHFPEGKAAMLVKELPYTNEVLISKGDLEEKIQTIKDLTTRMRELETEHAYKMRQTEVQHNDKMREVHQGYCEAIEELRDKIDKLQEDRTNELNNINVEIVKMKTGHEEAMQRMEASYDAKLITEYDKYQAFEERTNAMREDYERRLEELELMRKEELQKTVTKYEAQIHEKNAQLEDTHEEMAHQVRVHEQLKVQIEDDADREIVEIRTNYETLLYEERQNNLKLKGEAGVMRNKYVSGQKEMDELKRQVSHLQREQVQFQKNIQELEKNVVGLKKEIDERDGTIQDKEKRIYELKRNNQELEKFKFVLEYKIRELKNQIDPRDEEIGALKEKIQDMETELVNLHKTNVSLELQLFELREKLAAARREVQAEVEGNKRNQLLLRKIRIDLLDTAGLVQEPHALKIAVINLFHRYSDDEEFLRSRKADLDAQCEFMRQRDYLERTVASLRKQVFRGVSPGDKGLDKVLEENVVLITELNGLRDELKRAQKRIIDMENLLGIPGTKDVKMAEARNKLAKACHGQEELEKIYRTQMQECQHMVIMLKEDIKRLLNKLPPEEYNVDKNLL